MKKKNPLYVVKGKDVLEASSVIDLVVKKLNLEPLMRILQNILSMLLEQVKSYHMLKMVREFLDELIVKYFGLIKRFGLA